MPQSPRLDLRPGVYEPVVLLVSRREVEAGDLASVLSRLKVFLAAREDAWRYRGQMTLVVDGDNNDPRELVDIPEVRTLLRGLESSWPQWAYFFNQVDDSIKLLLLSVSLQSVTFDLSLGTTDPFNVSPASGLACVKPGRHRLLSLPES